MILSSIQRNVQITLVIIFAEDENVDIDAPQDLTQDVNNLGKVYNVLSLFWISDWFTSFITT